MNKEHPEPQPVVLVVDDDASMRDALKSLFRSIGLRAETFASAADLLHGDLPDAPSCLVLDVRLPASAASTSKQNSPRPTCACR